MTKRTLTYLIGGVALIAIVTVVLIVSVGNGDSNQMPGMTMTNGQKMMTMPDGTQMNTTDMKP